MPWRVVCTLLWYLLRKINRLFLLLAVLDKWFLELLLFLWHYPLQAPLCLPGTFSRSSCPFNSLASQFFCEAANQLVPLDVHFLFLLGFFFGSGCGCSVCFLAMSALLSWGRSFRLLSRSVSLWFLWASVGSSASMLLSLLGK